MDKRSVGNSGKDVSNIDMNCKRGADRPKNSAGRTGTFPSREEMASPVSMGNGSCITVVIFSNSEPVA